MKKIINYMMGVLALSTHEYDMRLRRVLVGVARNDSHVSGRVDGLYGVRHHVEVETVSLLHVLKDFPWSGEVDNSRSGAYDDGDSNRPVLRGRQRPGRRG